MCGMPVDQSVDRLGLKKHFGRRAAAAILRTHVDEAVMFLGQRRRRRNICEMYTTLDAVNKVY